MPLSAAGFQGKQWKKHHRMYTYIHLPAVFSASEIKYNKCYIHYKKDFFCSSLWASCVSFVPQTNQPTQAPHCCSEGEGKGLLDSHVYPRSAAIKYTLLCFVNNTPLLNPTISDGDICFRVSNVLLEWSGSWSCAAEQYGGSGNAGIHWVRICTLTVGLSSFLHCFLCFHHTKKKKRKKRHFLTFRISPLFHSWIS